MLTGEASDWSDERNRLLAVALTLLESETCASCGTPAWIGHSTNPEIGFKIESSVCHACAELDKDREKEQHGQRRSQRGELRYVTAYNVWEDQPLPSRYDSYQEMQED